MRTVRCSSHFGGRVSAWQVGCTPPPRGQTDTCENITFLQLLLRTVITICSEKTPERSPATCWFRIDIFCEFSQNFYEDLVHWTLVPAYNELPFTTSTRMHSSRMRPTRCNCRFSCHAHPLPCMPPPPCTTSCHACCPPPRTEFLTHACENIILPQLHCGR